MQSLVATKSAELKNFIDNYLHSLAQLKQQRRGRAISALERLIINFSTEFKEAVQTLEKHTAQRRFKMYQRLERQLYFFRNEVTMLMSENKILAKKNKALKEVAFLKGQQLKASRATARCRMVKQPTLQRLKTISLTVKSQFQPSQC